MHRYTVEKGNTTFTVLVNKDSGQDRIITLTDQPEYPKSWSIGMPIGEILMDYNNIKLTYAGDDDDGWHLVNMGDDTAKFNPAFPLTAEEARKKFSQLYQKNIYRIETEGGRIFYEACNDMPEKAALYKDLGARITLEVRYRRNSGLKSL